MDRVFDFLNSRQPFAKVFKVLVVNFDVISASVADSLEFLESDLKDPKLYNIDRVFDFLNSIHPFAKGFEVLIIGFVLILQQKAIGSIDTYLLNLEDTSIQMLNLLP